MLLEFLEMLGFFKEDRDKAIKRRFRRSPNIDFNVLMADKNDDIEVYRLLLKEWDKMVILRQYDEIECLMKDVDLTKVNVRPMVGLCRVTFPNRWAMPCWWDYVDRVIEELKVREEDWEDIMNGLLDRRKRDGK